MKFDKGMLRLYAVTDRRWEGALSLPRQVELALQGGATMVQFREKHLQGAEKEALARELLVNTDLSGEGIRAVIRDSVFLGLNTHYFVEMETGEEAEIIQESRIDSILEPSTKVRLTLNADKANVFDAETQLSLMRGVHNEAEVR